MSDELKHECAVAMVVLRKPPSSTADFGGTKLSLLLEKQHNRGQDGAGAAILSANPEPGKTPYWIAKSASATPLADLLGMLTKRCKVQTGLTGLSVSTASAPQNPVNLVNPVHTRFERIFLGHLRYATFGKNDVAFCHPFVHESSELSHTLLLAGNFNLTNAHELFDDYARHGSFPTSRADGYLICELIAKELGGPTSVSAAAGTEPGPPVADALANALKNADGAWTLCGATGDGWAFATRDPNGIRPGFYYIDERVVVVASERPAIQAAFDVPPEAVKELPPGEVLVVSPDGEVQMSELSSDINARPRPCSFERIYFSRANDADIHRERKALGAALLPRILEAADATMEDIFFSYIPNSARIAFHGLLEELFSRVFATGLTGLTRLSGGMPPDPKNLVNPVNPVKSIPRFGEVIVKDAKFRTFIADAAARREFYKHVYDVTYGLVKENDTLVVLDDSIVRGNTMKNAILPMLDRLGPKRIVIASSAPPIRYPDCYGIDMSTLGELVAFRALVNLMNGERGTGSGERELSEALVGRARRARRPQLNPLAPLYSRFTEEQHCAEIARLLTPPGMKAEVKVVYQTVEDLRRCLTSGFGHPTSAMEVGSPKSEVLSSSIGDWYFTGDYPTPGGYKVLHKALENYLDKRNERSY
ncbi:MAG: amidophosphoribosyltransferase [Lentisphaerae bacterium]|nr:amidophosphoribosyltransferase [Lentisphaerota bacterium]